MPEMAKHTEILKDNRTPNILMKAYKRATLIAAGNTDEPDTLGCRIERHGNIQLIPWSWLNVGLAIQWPESGALPLHNVRREPRQTSNFPPANTRAVGWQKLQEKQHKLDAVVRLRLAGRAHAGAFLRQVRGARPGRKWAYSAPVPTAEEVILAARRALSSLDRPVVEAIRSGAIRCLRVEWLLAQPDPWKIQRRQDIETIEAEKGERPYWTPDEAVRLLERRELGVLTYVSLPYIRPTHFLRRSLCVNCCRMLCGIPPCSSLALAALPFLAYGRPAFLIDLCCWHSPGSHLTILIRRAYDCKL